MIQRKIPAVIDPADDARRRKEFIVYPIIPRGEITLVSGSPRVGTSTLLLQIMEDFRGGKPVLGFPSYGATSAYVSCSHTRGVIHRLARRVGVPFDELNLTITGLNCKMPTFGDLAKELKRKTPHLEVVFLDGYHRLFTGNRKDYDVGTMGTDSIQKVLDELDLTLVAVGRGSKLTNDNAESTPMERFYGSIGTTERAATFISLERRYINSIDNPRRVITIFAQDAPIIQHWQFAPNGSFVPEDEAARESRSPSDALTNAESLVFVHPAGTELGTPQLHELIADACDVSERTRKRYICQWLEEGKLLKTGHGQYKIARDQ